MTTPSSGRPGVLCLDVEGGWGGSSRSIYYAIEFLDRERFQPVVVLRKPGPVEERYRKLDVPYVVAPEMPAFRPSERKNLVSFSLFLWRLRRRKRLYSRIAALVERHNVRLIHVNHESLAIVGYLIARRFGLPWIAHVRTLLIPGWFARRVTRLINRAAEHVIFITEPNRNHFAALVGDGFQPQKTSVVTNIMPVGAGEPSPHPALNDAPDKFRVLSLTNFSPNRGVDRIVDVAAELKARGETGIAFYLCGQPANRNALTGKIVPYYQRIRERVEALGLSESVYFPGHVSEPERALAAADALIKLTRQANPWGRDIMEALAAGLPVVTLGNYQGFVEDGVNGFIDEAFDPVRVADHLVKLKSGPALCARIAKANQEKARALFDGRARAQELETIYAGAI